MLLLHGLERGLILLRFGFFVRRRLLVSSDVLLQIRFAFLLGFKTALFSWRYQNGGMSEALSVTPDMIQLFPPSRARKTQRRVINDSTKIVR